MRIDLFGQRRRYSAAKTGFGFRPMKCHAKMSATSAAAQTWMDHKQIAIAPGALP
jgi:hypothetical protein